MFMFNDLANKAEKLLNKLDQRAAETLQNPNAPVTNESDENSNLAHHRRTHSNTLQTEWNSLSLKKNRSQNDLNNAQDVWNSAFDSCTTDDGVSMMNDSSLYSTPNMTNSSRESASSESRSVADIDEDAVDFVAAHDMTGGMGSDFPIRMMRAELVSLQKEVAIAMQKARRTELESEKVRTATTLEKSRLEQRMKALENLLAEKDAEVQRLNQLANRNSNNPANEEHRMSIQRLENKIQSLETDLSSQKKSKEQLEDELRILQSTSEAEKQRALDNINALSKKSLAVDDIKRKNEREQSELRRELENVRQELIEYKAKALKVLQTKDDVIEALKSNKANENIESDDSESIQQLQINEYKQEIALLREDLEASHDRLKSSTEQSKTRHSELKTELSSLKEELTCMEDQLNFEISKNSQLDMELTAKRTETRHAHDEMQRKINSLNNRVAEQDLEIDSLQQQIMRARWEKNKHFSGETEQNDQTEVLNETLVIKQAEIDGLVLEKNELLRHVNTLENHLKNPDAQAIFIPDTYSNPRNSFRRYSLPYTNQITKYWTLMLDKFFGDRERSSVRRNLQSAYMNLDKFSLRLTSVLSRYSVARIFTVVMLFWLIWSVLSFAVLNATM